MEKKNRPPGALCGENREKPGWKRRKNPAAAIHPDSRESKRLSAFGGKIDKRRLSAMLKEAIATGETVELAKEAAMAGIGRGVL